MSGEDDKSEHFKKKCQQIVSDLTHGTDKEQIQREMNALTKDPDFQRSKFGLEFNEGVKKMEEENHVDSEYRIKGNECARQGDYNSAIKMYTSGIEKFLVEVNFNYNERFSSHDRSSFHELAVLFSNRSEMYYRLGEYYKSLLDSHMVLETVSDRKRCTDINFSFNYRSLEIVLKTRIRFARILSGSAGNHSRAYQHLSRTVKIHHLSEEWSKKLVQESIHVGTLFHKRDHIYKNPEWEKRRDFSIFCVNVESVRERPLSISTKLRKRIHLQELNSFSMFNNLILLFGGRSSTFTPEGRILEYFNHLLIMDVKKLKLYRSDQIGQVPSPRSQHKTAIVGQKMYLFGGIDDNIEDWDSVLRGQFEKN